MRIGIDCHNLEINRTGTGRYLMNLLKYWSKPNSLPCRQAGKFQILDSKFILYFKNKIPKDILRLINRRAENKSFEAKILGSNSNTLFIHYFLPKQAKKDKIDILFCPNYIAPIFYKGEIALVLHDIIYEAKPKLYNWPSVFDKVLLKKVSKISVKKQK